MGEGRRNPLKPFVALSVAAALAHRQLSERKPEFYDVEHYSAVMNGMAQALARVAQIYVAESEDGEPRALDAHALAGATVQRGATLLVLGDGRSFRHVWLRREDLRGAVATLRRAGAKGYGRAQQEKEGN